MEELPRVVGLNVGGDIYTTTLYTITQYPESTIAKILDPVNRTPKDFKGNYFIDRDGALFKHVLSFLRTRKLTLPKEFTDFEQLESEAEFFGIKPLQEAVKDAAESSVAMRTTSNQSKDEILRLFYSSKTKLVLAGYAKTLHQLIPNVKELGGSLLSGSSYHFHGGDEIVEGGQLKVPLKLEQLDAFLQHVANQGFQVKMSNFFLDGNASQVWVFTRKFNE